MDFIPYKVNEVLENIFNQIPKELLVNPVYNNLDSNSILLYGLLLDRLSISMKNKWIDKYGNIYLIYSRKEAQKMLKLSDKPLSPEMKREVAKLKRYSNQMILATSEKLETIEDVKVFISKTTDDIADVTAIRQKYRNKLRNCTNEDLIKEFKEKRDMCSTLLKDYRNKLKIAN